MFKCDCILALETSLSASEALVNCSCSGNLIRKNRVYTLHVTVSPD